MNVRTRASMVCAIALSAWVLGSCGSTPDTGIRLEIDAALMPGHSLTRVHVRTYDYTDLANTTIDEHDFTISISSTTVPFSMSIVPRDASHPNMHLGIEVMGTLSNGPPVVSRVWTAFAPGRIFVVPVVLRDSCMPPCDMRSTCQAGSVCVMDAFVDPNSFPTYGVDAGRDVVSDMGSIDVPDTGPPPMDVIDVVDATDAQDVVDVPVPMDAIDAIDASDIVDAPDVIDTPDVPDVADVIDVPDVVDVLDVPDVSDIVDVPTDNGLGMRCGVGFCPSSGGFMWLCGPPPMMTSCCQPNPMAMNCSTVVCTNGYTCMIDPMGHPACCGAPIVP